MTATATKLSKKTAEEGIRKAAIVVASLDHEAADALLRQLGPAMAQKVRMAALTLDEVSPEERSRILDEFANFGPAPQVNDGGVELAGSLREAVGSPTPRMRASVEDLPEEPPFQSLREAEGEKLARLLSSERPQTVALVLSHLPTRQAGAAMSRLAPDLQAEVMRRLVDLEETDPEILRDVEKTLETRLSSQIRMQRKRAAGWEAVRGIIDSTEGEIGLRMLDNLAERDRDFATRFRLPEAPFTEIQNLDEDTFTATVRAVDPSWLSAALFGADPYLIHRTLRCMLPGKREELAEKLRTMGPIRISDMDRARKRLAEIAGRALYLTRRRASA